MRSAHCRALCSILLSCLTRLNFTILCPRCIGLNKTCGPGLCSLRWALDFGDDWCITAQCLVLDCALEARRAGIVMTESTILTFRLAVRELFVDSQAADMADSLDSVRGDPRHIQISGGHAVRGS
jgi:hypothetical protein